MKISKILFISGMLLAATLTSCDNDCISGSGSTVTQELTLGQFNSITLLGSDKVILHQGAEQRVIVEGQQNIINNINRTVSGGHWDIFVEECVKNSRGLTYTITVPNLDAIALSGSGQIMGTSNFESDNMTLILSGSGRLELDVAADVLSANITGSGILEITGDSDALDVDITGSGEFEGFGLSTDEADINISGSGNVEIAVSDFLRAVISGSGSVIYEGTPQIDTDITGSGTVRPR